MISIGIFFSYCLSENEILEHIEAALLEQKAEETESAIKKDNLVITEKEKNFSLASIT